MYYTMVNAFNNVQIALIRLISNVLIVILDVLIVQQLLALNV